MSEISLRDSTGDVVTGIKDEDLTAVLKWDNDGKIDSAEGYPRLIPINDKKKLAFTLTMDYSGSMFDDETGNKNAAKTDKINAMEKSVKKFIDMMESSMYCKIIKFGEKVIVTSGYSNSKHFLNQIVDAGSYPMGGTALYSSIYTALSDTIFSSNPTVMKSVIAFTDGMENSSHRLTIDSIYRKSNAMNTKIYTIGWFDFTGKYIPSMDELNRGKADLLNIARNSGGFFYRAGDAGDLDKIYSNIFKQILSSYNVSIVWNSSKLPPKGTQVKAELKINVKGITRVLYKNYIME
ncbi:MAG: vWA domain-containing protein [Chlorobi bacterium OLB5]|nr:MAG: vWA domain-containing protein [Chlorobi bacterium OLB5]